MLCESLLDGLDNCRWNYLRGLADAAEDEGTPDLARGWRWMADQRKWPMSWKYGYLFKLSGAPLKKMEEHGLPLVLYMAAKETLEATDTGAEDHLKLESWGGRGGLVKFMSTVAEAIGKSLGRPCPRRSLRQCR
jgi:hypothetical protein